MSLPRTVNIGGDPNDSNYRYKMQPLQTKIESGGNGVKTVLLNVVEVSKDLRTLPEYTTKFFSLELGAQTHFDKRRGVAIIKGRHERRDLQRKLRKFINAFILCPNCQLPELRMRVFDEKCVVKCASCDHTGKLPTRHRLKNYIINHPPTRNRCPPAPPSQRRQQRGSAKKEREVSRQPRPQPNRPINMKAWGSHPELEEEAKRRQAQLLMVTQSRKKTRRPRRNPHHDEEQGNELRCLRRYLSEEHSVNEICFELDRIVRAHDFDATKKMKLIFDALFDLDDEAIEQFIPTIQEKAELLERFTRTEKEFFLFVGCLEEILTVRQTRLADKATVSKILLAFYENEVLDESQLVQWYESPADSSWMVTKEDSQHVRDLAVPFMDWLSEADVEDEDDDEPHSPTATQEEINAMLAEL